MKFHVHCDALNIAIDAFLAQNIHRDIDYKIIFLQLYGNILTLEFFVLVI